MGGPYFHMTPGPHYVLTESTISGLRRSNGTRPSPDFLYGCEIKSGSGLGTRLIPWHTGVSTLSTGNMVQ